MSDSAPDTTPTSSTPELEHAADSAFACRDLTKQFGDRIAVDGLSLSVGKGEVFGFLGPNGAGKTTTVRMLGTLIHPTSGSATVAGLELSEANGVEIRQRISIMPETPGLYLRLNVTENLEYFGGLYGLADPGPRIGSALEAVRLTDRANDACGSLSKGLRQRVALARALLNDPEIIFLDEPTSGLDPVAAQAVHELIDDLRKSGVTIFLTTHRLDEAERLCDRVGIFSTTLRTVGRPDELRDQLFNRALSVQTATPLAAPAAVFGQVASIKSWITQGECTYLLTVTDPTIAAPEVIRILVRDGADVLSVSPVQHSLEDVYMQIVSRTAQAASP